LAAADELPGGATNWPVVAWLVAVLDVTLVLLGPIRLLHVGRDEALVDTVAFADAAA